MMIAISCPTCTTWECDKMLNGTTDLRDMKFSLGVKIQKQPDETFPLVQQTYLTDILAIFDMIETSSPPSPPSSPLANVPVT